MIQVWESGFRFWFGIKVWNSGFIFRFGIQFKIQDRDQRLRFMLESQVWQSF